MTREPCASRWPPLRLPRGSKLAAQKQSMKRDHCRRRRGPGAGSGDLVPPAASPRAFLGSTPQLPEESVSLQARRPRGLAPLHSARQRARASVIMRTAMGARCLRFALLVAVHTLLLPCSLCLNNGLGLTPPMGWNSWNHFRCHVSDALIRKTADAFVSTGLYRAGCVSLKLHARRLTPRALCERSAHSVCATICQ